MRCSAFLLALALAGCGSGGDGWLTARETAEGGHLFLGFRGVVVCDMGVDSPWKDWVGAHLYMPIATVFQRVLPRSWATGTRRATVDSPP